MKHENHPSVVKIFEKYSGNRNDFTFHKVNPHEIMLKLKRVNPRKATGYDNIPGKLIRLAHRELSFPISNLINAGLSQCHFPNSLKCAEVSPVFKKSDNLKKGNYRPVSVLTTLSKIFESVMMTRSVLILVIFSMNYSVHLERTTAARVS